MRALAAALLCGLATACTTSAQTSGPAPSGTGVDTAFAVDAVRSRFAGYTFGDASRNGYEPDRFCLDAAAFGRPPQLGAMGFHATNAALLRGPIAFDRPQALLYDGQGRMLGVEYEIAADAVRDPPVLFGRTFSKLPAHPPIQYEHYALHLWFIPNPSGQFADFNPSVACPLDSAPAAPHGPGSMPMDEDEMH